jgi:hypothetical protein
MTPPPPRKAQNDGEPRLTNPSTATTAAPQVSAPNPQPQARNPVHTLDATPLATTARAQTRAGEHPQARMPVHAGRDAAQAPPNAPPPPPASRKRRSTSAAERGCCYLNLMAGSTSRLDISLPDTPQEIERDATALRRYASRETAA